MPITQRQKNSPLTINHYLLERIGVTIIYPKFFLGRNCQLIIQSAFLVSFSSYNRSTRDRERICNIKGDTFATSQSHPPFSQSRRVCGSQLNSPVNFSTDYCPNVSIYKIRWFLNILKFSISLVWCHFTKLLRYLIMIITRVPNFHHGFYFTSVKLRTRHENILFTFGLPVLRILVYPILCSLVHALDLSNLTRISAQRFYLTKIHLNNSWPDQNK